MDILFDFGLYGIIGVALIWASNVSTKVILGLLQFVWYNSAFGTQFLSQGLNGYWSIFRDGINISVDGYDCPILIEYCQTDICA